MLIYISFFLSRPEFPDTECIVRRRYTDFVWLHNKLVESLPSHIIPPLPEKHSLLEHLNRYCKEFIVIRMKLLDQFLRRVTSHPALSSNVCVTMFLTAKLAEFSSYKKANKMSESFYNLSNIYSSLSSRHHSSEFEQFSLYISNLYDKISAFEKIGLRLHKERKEYVSEAHQFAIVLNHWASYEPKLSVAIRQVRFITKSRKNKICMFPYLYIGLMVPLNKYVVFLHLPT